MSWNNFDDALQCFQIPATEKPGFFAVRSGTERLAYAGLDARTGALCDQLTAAGIEKGARAGILLDRSLSTITSFLAVMKAGGPFVPLDPSHPPINGVRGERDAIKKLNRRVEYKLKYIEKFSISKNGRCDST